MPLKSLDLVTPEGVERACQEFEEMGKGMSPIAYMVGVSVAAQAAAEHEGEIQKGKRPSAEISFREFFTLLMLFASQKESL